jgi:type IV pilus assembly protein PilM
MAGSKRRRAQREEIVAIDLGTRTTKAVLVRRVGDAYLLLNYAMVDAPSMEQALSRGVWADHLRKVLRGLGGATRRAVIAVGSGSVLLTHADLPPAAPSDLRKVIKLSPKAYLQQDMPDHVFDCHVGSMADEGAEVGGLKPRRKSRVLVASARRSYVEDLADGARDAGLALEGITPTSVATANAFRATSAEELTDPVALLDVGFRSSTISILHEGDLALTRVVNVGAEMLSAALDQANQGWAQEQPEEENSLSDTLQASVQKAISGLAREVDASIGFFLSQFDRPVSQLFVSGGSARSHFILQTLEMELGLPCRSWNPAGGLQLRLPRSKAGEIEYEAPQLTAAVGAVMGRLDGELIQVNLLAERQEALEWRRRNPVRRLSWAAALLLMGMLAWGGWLGWQIWEAQQEVRQVEEQMTALRMNASQPLADSQRATELDRRREALMQHEQQRYLVAGMLDALQYVMVDGIQFHRMAVERQLRRIEPPRLSARQRRAGVVGENEEKAETREQFILRIQAKNYEEDPRHVSRLIDSILGHAYFQERLHAQDPVRLVEVQSQQVDPAQPTRKFQMFTIECRFAERVFKHD